MKITVKNITDSALQVSENLVEGSLATGAKWQKLSAKLMQEGAVLFEKQQDLTLSALEDIKGIVVSGNKRFRNLLGVEFRKVKKTAKAIKVEQPIAAAKASVTKVSKTVTKAATKPVASKPAPVKATRAKRVTQK